MENDGISHSYQGVKLLDKLVDTLLDLARATGIRSTSQEVDQCLTNYQEQRRRCVEKGLDVEWYDSSASRLIEYRLLPDENEEDE